jgi:UDP-glucose 4-epimerase
MKEKNRQKVVVTGGAGFIGSNLVKYLLEKDFDVHVIDNLSGGSKEKVDPRAVLHVADIRNIEEIQPIFDGATYVFHLAALPRVQYSIENPKETHDVNVNGTLNVLMASKNAGVKKVVYSASSAVYGDQDVMPLHEEVGANPKSPYGLQKHVGELLCKVWSQVYDLPTVSLRYFNVYGPGQSEEGAYALVIAKFLKQKREGKPLTITGDGEQTRDYTSVHDVVRANYLAAIKPEVGAGEVFNIGSGKNHSVNTVAKMIGGETEYIPARLEPKHTLADNSKAQEVLGWKPEISFEKGIAELLETV